MAGVKGKSGRKPDLKNTDAKNLDRRDRAERAQENNTGFEKIGKAPNRLDDFSKKLWTAIVDELDSKELLTKLDEPLLEEYVTQVSLSRMADESIRDIGVIYITEKGEPKKNPAVDVKNNAAKNIKAIGSSLGLDPISRAAVLSDSTTGDEDDLDETMSSFGVKT